MERTIFDGIQKGPKCDSCIVSDFCPAIEVAKKLAALSMSARTHAVTPRLDVHLRPSKVDSSHKVIRTSVIDRIDRLEASMGLCSGGFDGPSHFDVDTNGSFIKGGAGVNALVVGMVADVALADQRMLEEGVPWEVRHLVPTPTSAPSRSIEDFRASQAS